MSTRAQIILALVAVGLLFSMGTATGYGIHWYLTLNRPTSEEVQRFSVLWEAWRIIQSKFYGDIPPDPEPVYGAVRGMVDTLKDRYTVFVEPEPRSREKEELRGEFGGIGALVRRNEAGEVLLEPMEDSPAAQAGVQKGDLLIQVDDTPITTTMRSEEVVALIRGEVGTQVRLTLKRAGLADPLVVTVTRQTIQTPSVTWRVLEQDARIGYVKIDLFTERTNQELTRALQELRQAGVKSLILDVRDNGGGLLDASVDVASQFLDKGVVLYESRRQEAERSYEVKGGGLAVDLPLAVLVNGATASASEILAGALQDHQRAVLIGQHTFGKGSVQLVYDLSDNSSLHVTVARWLTPKRRQIEGAGLAPDIEVAMSDEDRAAGADPQLERAIAYLRERELGKDS